MKVNVSIIIATYNSEKTISRALDSVINQRFQDWECIVVDGLSKDSTIQIVQEYVEKDNRIRYISEKDHGIYDAFNKGWKIAKGTWIHYLGSDDWLTENSFCSFFNNGVAVAPEASIMSGNIYRVTRNGRTKEVSSNEWRGGHQAKLTRRDILIKYEGFDESYKYLADAELIYRIKRDNNKVVNVNTVVAFYSYGGASESFSHQVEIAKERLSFYKLDSSIKHRKLIVIRKFIIGVASILKTHICGR